MAKKTPSARKAAEDRILEMRNRVSKVSTALHNIHLQRIAIRDFVEGGSPRDENIYNIYEDLESVERRLHSWLKTADSIMWKLM